MHITKRFLVLMLALVMALGLASCANGDSALDILESVPDLETSKEVSQEVSEPDPEPAEGQTAMPVITQTFNNSQKTVIIAGTCEEGATVSASFVGGEVSTVKASGKVFALEVNVEERQEAHIQVTATAEGKTESEPKLVIAGYHPTAEGNLVYPTVLADGVTLFSSASIDVLSESNVVANTTIDTLINRVKVNLNSLKKFDTELIYVMLPNKASVMSDALPADAGVSESITLYTQVKNALTAADATVIDMRDVFAEADTSKYPLYYRTHSAWSEYGAYLTYQTVMNHIAEKFPEAAPRAIEDFDVKEVKDALGGDLVYHFGLDSKVFTETVYDFVPKFDLKLGDKIPEELAEDYTDKYLISDIKQYLGDNDYRYYNEYFVGKQLGIDPSVTRGDEAFGFFTDRAELPTALIYRDEYSFPMIDMLAERFNNSMFESAGKLNFKFDAAVDYAAEGKDNVDYILVFVSEDSLPKFIIANAN